MNLRARSALLAALSFLIVGLPPMAGVAAAMVVEFQYVGGQQTWQVPAGVGSIIIEAWGAQGGNGDQPGNGTSPGGLGGYAKGTLSVSAGDTLFVYVGGKGGDGNRSAYQMTGVGGWNGGGSAGQSDSDSHSGAGGGGASDVRLGGTSLNDRRIVAGGGGGAGAADSGGDGGGQGGGTTGGDGLNNGAFDPLRSGRGGTQTAGGASWDPPDGNGTFGVGGTGTPNAFVITESGGGGGWYGGGVGSGGNSSNSAGAGGGSSYLGGVSGGSTSSGTRTGHGLVRISYNAPPTAAPLSPPDGTTWQHTTTQAFSVMGTDPEGGPYRGEFVITPVGGGSSRQLTTPLTPSGQAASVTASPALAPGSYTWQTRACDSESGCSPYSSTRSLTVEPNGGPAITSVAPPTGQSWTHNDAQTFSVTATDPEADTFSAEVVVTPDGGGPAVTFTTGTVLSGQTASVTASPALPPGAYSWQARACDSLGTCSTATAARTLTVLDNRAPSVALVSPAEGGIWGYNAAQTFTVNGVDPDADAYTAEVVVTPSGGGADRTATSAATGSGQDASVTLSPSLAPGSYTWKARTCDALSACSPFSAGRTFTISPNMAATTTLVSPADGAKSTTTGTQTFTVNATDPDLDAYKAAVVITPSTGGAGVTIVGTLTPSGQDSAVSPSPKLASGTYTWKARACDLSNVCGGYTATRALVVNDPPAAPSVVQPGPGATFDVGQTQEFRLKAVDPESDSYSVEVDVQNLTGATERSITTGSAASGTEVSGVATPPLAAGIYQWRARACDSGSGTCGPYTPLVELTVADTPVCPNVVIDGWVGQLYGRFGASGLVNGAMTVCLGGAVTGGLLQAGTVTVQGLGASSPVTEGTSTACPAADSLELLRVEQDEQNYIRAYAHAAATHTSICMAMVQSGSPLVDKSVTVANPNPSQAPSVQHSLAAGPAPADRKPLRLDRPSAACQSTTGGTLTRLVNANILGQWVTTYAHQTLQRTVICTRVEGGQTLGGALVLVHDGQVPLPVAVLPGVGPRDPGSPCPTGTTVGSAGSSVTVGTNTGDPVAVCVAAGAPVGPQVKGTLAMPRNPAQPQVPATWSPDQT